MGSAVRLQAVSVSFPSPKGLVRALGPLDLEVRRGAFVCVVGPSGSGKTTLLNVVAGLTAPTTGRVWVGGRELSEAGSAEAARLRREHIGLVFQAFHLLPQLTAVDNVALPMWLAGRRRGTRERALALLDGVGLSARASHRPGSLSGGEQQRVAIARAIANEPAVVLADEPTGDLDAAATRVVLDALGGLRQRGTTLLVATHDPTVAAMGGEVVRLGSQTVTKTSPSFTVTS